MKLDVVIPFFNEEACAGVFLQNLLEKLSGLPGVSPSLVLVDDGSSDKTPAILDELAARDSRVRVIHLWGNHGHQKALVAGLDACAGDAVLMMDGDGQHPVDVALRMVNDLRANPALGVVQGLRKGTQGGLLKNITSSFFYWVAARMVPDAVIRPGASDFRVVSRPVVDLLKRYPDRHRNLRMLLAALNLPTAFVEYDVAPRLAGASRYGLRRMLELAANGWFAFSSSPLRLSLLLMLGTGAVGLLYVLYVLAVHALGRTVPGWTSLIAFMAFLFSAVFGVLAILSEYVARIYADVRGHPVYRVRPDAAAGARENQPS